MENTSGFTLIELIIAV
ncbi:prepilin-type N-terminal cleavage/methylation domain-containing protein, partial [Thalassotalea sp. G20_0]|nr:prepilin-type N-terminal cleavage/methylation domain-containing protein [Thalassotalea sp. G20_0]